MKGRAAWVVGGLLAVAAASGLVLAGRRAEAAGSTLSRGAGGWLAARTYLEQRGIATRLLDGPLAEAPPGGVLALVFPWQSRRGDADVDAVRAHLDAGGTVLLAFAGDLAPGAAEAMLLQAVGAEVEPVAAVPVPPWRWRRDERTWALRPVPAWRGQAEGLTLRRPQWLPRPPEGVLLAGPGGEPVVAAWSQRGGRVVVLPAELLCNARLREAPHAALLETLARALPAEWAFDELHHGLVRPGEPVASAARRGFDLLLTQLALLYAAAALALGRRLGPAWREAPPLVGSAAAFLLRLGRLHHRLGHHRDGAALLLRRAAELDRRFAPAPELAALAERGDAGAFVELARRLGHRDRERSRHGGEEGGRR